MDSQFLQRLRSKSTAAVRWPKRNLQPLGLERLHRIRVRLLAHIGAIAREARHPNRPAARLQPATALIAAIGGLVAIGGYFGITEYANDRLQTEFDRAAREVSSVLTRSVDRHVEVTESIAARFNGSDAEVSRWAFFELARGLPDRNPGLSALQWIPRVPHGQRGAYERKASADGLFDFHFLERTEDGGRVRAKSRAKYFPVYFVEPYPGNEAVLGLDLAADGDVADFLARVRDAGRTAVAPAGLMPVGHDGVPGFAVVVPTYDASVAPFSVEERRNALTGFVRANFRFDRLLQSLRAGFAGLPTVEVYILDSGDGRQPSIVHFFSSEAREGPDKSIDLKDAYQGVFTAVDHEVAGRQWRIVVKPAGGAIQNVLRLAAWGFAGFTLLLTGLLLRYLAVIRRGREKAEAANRAKSDFLAMMSHELRTPLNSVIGFSDVMMNELFGPLGNKDYKTYTGHINRSARHLLGLINNILDLSKVESGHLKLAKEDFAIREIWGSVRPMLQERFRDSGVDLTENLSRSHIVLHGDPRAFHQVLHNLVSNAMKFTAAGGKVTVTAGVGRDGGFTLRVADTGIGIAEEDIDTVLKPFRQVDNSLSRKYEGVGLGLPLTRQLVELQGGELLIESKLGEGTAMTVALPGSMVAGADVSRKKGLSEFGPTRRTAGRRKRKSAPTESEAAAAPRG